MLEFISNNSILFIAIVFVIIFVLLFFIIKTSRSGKKEITQAIVKDKKEAETISETDKKKKSKLKIKKQKNAKKESEDLNLDEKEQNITKKRVKKAKEKKSIEQVFKREETQSADESNFLPESNGKTESSISEEELLSKMEFVKSSKKVSKLVKLSEKEELAAELESLVTDEPYLPPAVDESVESKRSRRHYHLKEHTKHFDKSKRLSKLVEQENFDEMFDSHISENYLDIDISRHLDTSENVLNKLYDRASKTLANSDKRLISDDDEDNEKRKTDKAYEEAYIEGKRREIFAKLIAGDEEEEISEDMQLGEIDIDEKTKLDTKTLLVAEAVVNRKKNKRN